MFSIGEKVVCVNAATQAQNLPTLLVKGNVYTVAGLVWGFPDQPGITIEEMPVPFPSRRVGWHAWRFRKAVASDLEAETSTKELVHI